MIELYAITDHPGPPLPEPLHAVPCDGLAAVCARESAEREVSSDELWRHEEVVEALMEDRDVLPVRYGTRLEDDAAVARVLEERRQDLLEALERVRGAVELSVRVRGDADGTALQVHARLSALARSSTRRMGRAPGELLRAAYLVERDSVQDFVRQVSRLHEANPDISLLCTGPWPPYSFVER